MGSCTAGVFRPTTGSGTIAATSTARRTTSTISIVLTVTGFTGTVQGVATNALTQLAANIIAAATALGQTITVTVSAITAAVVVTVNTTPTSAAAFSASLGLTALVAATLAYLH